MKNAAPFIQGQAANVTTHTNNESGVLRTINALLDQRIKQTQKRVENNLLGRSYD